MVLDTTGDFTELIGNVGSGGETGIAVRRRRLNLPREICFVSLRRLRLPRGILTAGQKSAEGILDHDVGKASEALQSRKAESTDRLSRERWLKAQTRGEASRT
jgi:hypothetical protein